MKNIFCQLFLINEILPGEKLLILIVCNSVIQLNLYFRLSKHFYWMPLFIQEPGCKI